MLPHADVSEPLLGQSYLHLWQHLTPTGRLILASQVVRTAGLGGLAVTFALYLQALGYTGVEIGAFLTGGVVSNIVLNSILGPIADLWRRKPLLVAGEILIGAVALAASFSAALPVLVAAALLGGFGRGRSGSGWPLAGAEHAWLAEQSHPAARPRLFALSGACNLVGAGLGALASGFVHSAKAAGHAAPAGAGQAIDAQAFRPVFLAAAVSSIIVAVLLLCASEIRPSGGVPGERRRGPGGRSIGLDATPSRSDQPGFLGRLLLVYAIGGVALGLTGTMVSYYFKLKFSSGPGAIGPTFALGFFASAVASLYVGKVSERRGLVRSWVMAQTIGVALLVLVPVAPTFGWAASIFILHNIVAQATVGPTQAFIVNVLGDRRRATGLSLNSAVKQGGSALTPLWAGALFQNGASGSVFLIAGLAEIISIALYGVLLGRYETRRLAAGSSGAPSSLNYRL